MTKKKPRYESRVFVFLVPAYEQVCEQGKLGSSKNALASSTSS
jgi:hypothetical protein